MAARQTAEHRARQRQVLLAALIVFPLGGCGHSDLKAPCGPVAQTLAATVLPFLFPLWPPAAIASFDCGPLKPANG
jgi:hypothetical protein